MKSRTAGSWFRCVSSARILAFKWSGIKRHSASRCPRARSSFRRRYQPGMRSEEHGYPRCSIWTGRKRRPARNSRKPLTSPLLDSLQEVGINTVYVQVRPAGDALYPSTLVPWSKVLTGIQGADPGYDPVAFMVEETHKRNMEFHAWFNPFRANTDILTASLDPSHVAISHPDWIVNTGKQLYINPGFLKPGSISSIRSWRSLTDTILTASIWTTTLSVQYGL